MPGLVESATAVMSMASRRLDIVAQNVSNIATPGYKRRRAFADFADGAAGAPALPAIAVRRDDAQGRLQQTGNPLDIALNGPGYLAVRHGDAILYTRQGQFRRDANGLLVTPQGYALQQAGGGDLVTEGDVAIAPDGAILADGQPIGRIGTFRAAPGTELLTVSDSFLSARADGRMEEAADLTLRSGMVEGSNVELADEMTHSMLALRQAESGARLIQLYDELLGKAASTFAQGGGR